MFINLDIHTPNHMNHYGKTDVVNLKKRTLIGVMMAVFASSVLVVMPAASMGQPLIPGRSTPPQIPSTAAPPPVATSGVHCHNAACWLSNWYATHPQYQPTPTDIQEMKANASDVVPGYTIPAPVNK